MAEGPQVKLTADWLNASMSGRTPVAVEVFRDELEDLANDLARRRLRRVFSKGKHLFLEFEGEVFVHNQRLMHGRWRSLRPADAEIPPHTWLALRFDDRTICNIKGQRLALLDARQVDEKLRSLGPDVMATPYPREGIAAILGCATRPIGEAMLDQSAVSGVGNIAKSEALFLAHVDPRIPGEELSQVQIERLVEAIRRVTRDSYVDRGRWATRMYRRAGKPCPQCSTPIVRFVQGKPPRSTYFCPSCQVFGARNAAGISPAMAAGSGLESNSDDQQLDLFDTASPSSEDPSTSDGPPYP
jgi:endonuclease-8